MRSPIIPTKASWAFIRGDPLFKKSQETSSKRLETCLVSGHHLFQVAIPSYFVSPFGSLRPDAVMSLESLAMSDSTSRTERTERRSSPETQHQRSNGSAHRIPPRQRVQRVSPPVPVPPTRPFEAKEMKLREGRQQVLRRKPGRTLFGIARNRSTPGRSGPRWSWWWFFEVPPWKMGKRKEGEWGEEFEHLGVLLLNNFP